MRHPALLAMLACLAFLPACRPSTADVMESAEASWRKGDYEKAIMLNRAVLARDPKGKNGAQALLNIGNIYYRNLRQIRSAISTYSHVAQEFPGSPQEYQARRCLAEIYADELKDATRAIAEYDRLLAMPQLADAAEIRFRRADLYFKNEEFDRALRELLHIRDQGVSGRLADQVLLKIGAVYLAQKRFEEALGPFQEVARSPYPESRRQAILGMTDAYEGLYDFDKAIAAIRGLDPSPENEQRIAREVARLEKRRRELESPAEIPGLVPGRARKRQ